MVKRWEAAEFNMVLDETGGGEYVLYSDYQALQKALEESLDQWWHWMTIPFAQRSIIDAATAQDRIAQLRSLYLKGGE